MKLSFRLHRFNCFHLSIRHFEFLCRLPLSTVRYSMFLVSPSFYTSVTSFHDLPLHIYSNIKLNTFPILKSPWHNCSWEDKGDSLETIVVCMRPLPNRQCETKFVDVNDELQEVAQDQEVIIPSKEASQISKKFIITLIAFLKRLKIYAPVSLFARWN